ncbi:ANTAR domain-containing protein [Modestobacter versicolor]|uniref:ANTAR domain-containing protein n=1 Tax=Modestobacter versicolor TaxID=429133 RepID=UPI0034DE4256
MNPTVPPSPSSPALGAAPAAVPALVPAPPSVPTPALLPDDVLRTAGGQPAVLVVRTGRGWTVLCADPGTGWAAASAEDLEGPGVEGVEALPLVEAMSLADLVAAELGANPEPGRDARRAARTTPAPDAGELDPRDQEIVALRRTVGQLEHALAARVSIERAIGVLAERHGTTPREAFEELRRRARSQGRPAQELAVEVLEELPARDDAPGPRSTPAAAPPVPPVLPAPGPRPAANGTARRVHRSPRHADGGSLPGAPR